MSQHTSKVLQIFNQYLEYGGEEGSVVRIAALLRKKAYVVTYRGSSSDILSQPGGKLKMPFLMQKNKKVLSDLRKLQQEESFDVWQIHNVFPGLSVAVYELAAELGVPVIQYLHNYRFGCADATYFRNGKACFDCRPDHFFPAIKHRCWRQSLPATLSMVAALKRFWKKGGVDNIKAYIAISEAQKQAHVRMGFPEDDIHVLYHYLDAGEVCDSIPSEKGDVLFIGRLTDEKGVELLIRSWAKVDRRGRKLRIVGKGPMLGFLKKLVQSEGVEGIVFEGFVPKEDHARLWENCSFFVAPSVWEEPFGMVILEAWKKNRPVLATNLGSFPELIDHRVNGWLADANVDAFAEGLQEALDSTGQYLEMGRKGQATLSEKYNSEVWLESWVRLYESVSN